MDNDCDALARAIEQLLDDPAMLNSFSEAARKRAEDFSMRRQAQKMLAAYEQAMEAHRTGRTLPIPRPKGVLKTILNGEARHQLAKSCDPGELSQFHSNTGSFSTDIPQ
jgi:hypothetical protein